MLYVFLSFIFPFWLISDIILSNFCHLGYNNLTKKYKQKRKIPILYKSSLKKNYNSIKNVNLINKLFKNTDSIQLDTGFVRKISFNLA